MSPDHVLDPAEEPHCVCPIKEAHAGMDEMGDYLDAHAPTTSRAPACAFDGESA